MIWIDKTCTVEEFCRRTLAEAVNEGLVLMAPGVRPPKALSCGDLTGLANWMTDALSKWRKCGAMAGERNA